MFPAPVWLQFLHSSVFLLTVLDVVVVDVRSGVDRRVPGDPQVPLPGVADGGSVRGPWGFFHVGDGDRHLLGVGLLPDFCAGGCPDGDGVGLLFLEVGDVLEGEVCGGSASAGSEFEEGVVGANLLDRVSGDAVLLVGVGGDELADRDQSVRQAGVFLNGEAAGVTQGRLGVGKGLGRRGRGSFPRCRVR